MPSIYLEPADYATYGVPNATVADVMRASAFIDGYLNRPDGLIYAVNLEDEPDYMVTTGLPITKVQSMPLKGNFALAFKPVVKLLSVEYNRTQGLPPVWNTVSGSIVTDDGVLYVGTPNIPYDQIRVKYVSGWLYANLPSAIKIACANIIQVIEEGVIASSVTKLRAGDTEMDFGSTKGTGNIFIDTTTASLLNPYKATFA